MRVSSIAAAFLLSAAAACEGSGSYDSALDGMGPDAGSLALNWPFSYTATSDGLIAVHTDGGDVYASIGPWGSHFWPNSGHAYGDPKSDSAVFFTRTLSELTDVNGDPCTDGGACVIAEQVMVSKIPTYIAPAACIVTAVDQDRTATQPRYYPTNLQYSIRMQAGNYNIILGHIGKIAPGLRDKVLAATCARGTCVDVATWQEFGTGTADNLMIAVAAGEALAQPNVAALPSSRSGYYMGSGQANWPPWAQVEFFVSDNTGTLCYFDTMDTGAKASLQNAIDHDMVSADSVRFRAPGAQDRKWEWAAEARACNAHSVSPMDPVSLHANLGGWWQVPLPGGTAAEVLAFATIAKDTATYDPNLYSNPVPDSLVLRTKAQGATTLYHVVVPGLPAIDTNRLSGELLEETNGALLVHWRDVRTMAGTFDWYQRGAFAFGGAGLMARWGEPAATADQAPVPVLSASDTCDTAGIDCYDHNPTGAY